MISVILPSYNEEDNISRAAEQIGQVLQSEDLAYELIFVNDGSTDTTWQKITDLSHENSHVVGVNFSRNFGKEAWPSPGGIVWRSWTAIFSIRRKPCWK